MVNEIFPFAVGVVVGLLLTPRNTCICAECRRFRWRFLKKHEPQLRGDGTQGTWRPGPVQHNTF